MAGEVVGMDIILIIPILIFFENYTTGTLLVDMIDPSTFDIGSNQVESIWVAAVNGLVEGSGIQNRLISSINQCFSQSPYLGK